MDHADARQHNARYLASHAESGLTGWRVLIEQPLSRLHVQTERYYLMTVAWLLGAIGLSLVLARAADSGVTSPLEDLVNRVRQFSVQGDPPGRKSNCRHRRQPKWRCWWRISTECRCG